jgi:hypothetical protein
VKTLVAVVLGEHQILAEVDAMRGYLSVSRPQERAAGLGLWLSIYLYCRMKCGATKCLARLGVTKVASNARIDDQIIAVDLRESHR